MQSLVSDIGIALSNSAAYAVLDSAHCHLPGVEAGKSQSYQRSRLPRGCTPGVRLASGPRVSASAVRYDGWLRHQRPADQEHHQVRDDETGSRVAADNQQVRGDVRTAEVRDPARGVDSGAWQQPR